MLDLRQNSVCLEQKNYSPPGNFTLPPVATVVTFRVSAPPNTDLGHANYSGPGRSHG